MEEHQRLSRRAMVMFRCPDGMPVGGGLLAREGLVVTCAHVVNSALGRAPDESSQPDGAITLCFPFLGHAESTALIVGWWPRGHAGIGLRDLAVLRCGALPEHAAPLEPVKATVLAKRGFKACGFPAVQPDGAWLHANIHEAIPGGWHQFERAQGRQAQGGFSGCAAFEDPHEDFVFGLIVEADPDPHSPLGCLVPSHILHRALDTVAGTAPVPRPARPQGNWRSLLPPLPETFVPRPALFARLKAAVLDEGGEAAALVGAPGAAAGAAVAVGMGGVGKTLLAIALAQDPDVQECYPDGVVWVALGQTPELMRLVGVVAGALGEPVPDLQHPREARNALAGWFRDRACLLVLDDVWNPDHLLPFDAMGAQSRLLVTTRHVALGKGLGARAVPVDELEPDAALQVLAKAAGVSVAELPPEATLVAKECGYLALALAMAGGMARGGAYGWGDILARFQAHDLARIRQRLSDYPHPDLYSMVEVGVQALGPAQSQMYLDFCVFPEDTPAPLAALEALWAARGFDAETSRDFAGLLVERSLARRVGDDALQLHDIQYDFVMHETDDLPLRHVRMLEGYGKRSGGDWADGPRDGYFFEHLPRHLHGAGRLDELGILLCSARWLLAKVDACGIDACIADFARVSTTPGSARALLLHALRLAAPAVRARPRELTGQLLGRLLGVAAPPAPLPALMADLRAQAPTGTLLPLNACLTPPGGAELFALIGHTGSVSHVALSVDGLSAVSASNDGTLRVWDLAFGVCVRTLEGHDEQVKHVALSVDGQRVVSASVDHTLRVWGLPAGECIHTLEGHTAVVNHVALTKDCQRAVSASDDHTLRVWDLASGACVHIHTGHGDSVNHVALSGDGKSAVSASDDHALRVWDLATGSCVHTLVSRPTNVLI